MELSKLVTLSLAEARKESGHDLWVLNTSDTAGVSDDSRRADVNFTVSIPGEEEPLAIRIPATWLPQDLGSFADRSLILKSTKFLQSVRNGYLTIISTEQAETLLQTPEARSETTRMQVNKNRGVNVTMTGEPRANKTLGVQPWVLEAVQRPDLNDSERAALFRTNAANLKLADIDYALEQLGTSSDETAQYLRKRRMDNASRR